MLSVCNIPAWAAAVDWQKLLFLLQHKSCLFAQRSARFPAMLLTGKSSFNYITALVFGLSISLLPCCCEAYRRMASREEKELQYLFQL